MNDLLQSLRSNQSEKQRPVMTRKNYDATYYDHNQSFQYANRLPQGNYKRHYAPDGEAVSSQLRDAIESLNTAAESFADNQKHLIDAQEKTNGMLERQVIAIERILDHLNISSK
ncbi:MAG: hypothetical protein GY699_05250 [Desulfobacteraceae bacterium]|nr:hypothetical protein [Desulfobacteraceae bacterium]